VGSTNQKRLGSNEFLFEEVSVKPYATQSLVSAVGASMLIGRLAVTERKADRSVIVQAGRRVDATNAETVCFPVANVNRVKDRIKAELVENNPLALVSSAACGTDLLALEVAEQIKVDRFILLPSQPAAFRASSVSDRPGNWGDLFDRLMKTSHVEVLTLPEGQQGYLETNLKLLDKAQSMVKKRHVELKAMVAWNQESKGPDDVTAHFLEQARLRYLPIIDISTL
jgi:hypothetical protein